MTKKNYYPYPSIHSTLSNTRDERVDSILSAPRLRQRLRRTAHGEFLAQLNVSSHNIKPIKKLNYLKLLLLHITLFTSVSLNAWWTPWSVDQPVQTAMAEKEMLEQKRDTYMKEIHEVRLNNDIKALAQLNYNKTAEVDIPLLYKRAKELKTNKNDTAFPSRQECADIIERFKNYSTEYGNDVLKLSSEIPLILVKNRGLQAAWKVIQQEHGLDPQPLCITWQYKQRNNQASFFIENYLVINAAFFPLTAPFSDKDFVELHRQALMHKNMLEKSSWNRTLKQLGTSLGVGIATDSLAKNATTALYAAVASAAKPLATSTASAISSEPSVAQLYVATLVAGALAAKGNDLLWKGVDAWNDSGVYQQALEDYSRSYIHEQHYAQPEQHAKKLLKPDFAQKLTLPVIVKIPPRPRKSMTATIISGATGFALTAAVAHWQPAWLKKIYERSPLKPEELNQLGWGSWLWRKITPESLPIKKIDLIRSFGTEPLSNLVGSSVDSLLAKPSTKIPAAVVDTDPSIHPADAKALAST